MADQITSFYVRGGEQNRIMLSMLLGHNFELTTLVRQVTGDQVTPVFLSGVNAAESPELLRSSDVELRAERQDVEAGSCGRR